ncbi:MAG: urease accessory protein UreE [Gammaproteobacteria bacterium]|nr:urease accessory protein UreE [Gammaproteobacteria bacterium]
MLHLTRYQPRAVAADESTAGSVNAAMDELVLPFELRQRSRLRAMTQRGQEVGLFLDRGLVLRDGDRLSSEDGVVVRVRAAPEHCSTVRASDPLALTRAAYHLGNRHVMLQVGAGFLRYRHDHVLDAMLRAMGLRVFEETVPFEPEAGAYPGAHGHVHGHSHGHSHDHEHAHAKGQGRIVRPGADDDG